MDVLQDNLPSKTLDSHNKLIERHEIGLLFNRRRFSNLVDRSLMTFVLLVAKIDEVEHLTDRCVVEMILSASPGVHPLCRGNETDLDTSHVFEDLFCLLRRQDFRASLLETRAAYTLVLSIVSPERGGYACSSRIVGHMDDIGISKTRPYPGRCPIRNRFPSEAGRGSIDMILITTLTYALFLTSR